MLRPITDTLRHIGAGCLMDEASEKMATLVHAVSASGKPGKLTITIELRKATAGALAVAGKVAIKTPAEPKIEALMFPTPEGNLLTEDPSQTKLDLRPVAVETREIREVATA